MTLTILIFFTPREIEKKDILVVYKNGNLLMKKKLNIKQSLCIFVHFVCQLKNVLISSGCHYFQNLTIIK
jgi:hypothetical protein